MKRKTLSGSRKGPPPTYVPHPRYGAAPRVTGLNPDPKDPGVRLHHHTLFHRAIAGTAIAANVARQVPATVEVTHYFDIERPCRDCDRPFLFFAAEQKHWYETLRFSTDADAVRCHPCRRDTQVLQRARSRYEALLAEPAPTANSLAELAALRLDLVEDGQFSPRQLDHVRHFLNQHADHSQSGSIRDRLQAIERESEASAGSEKTP